MCATDVWASPSIVKLRPIDLYIISTGHFKNRVIDFSTLERKLFGVIHEVMALHFDDGMRPNDLLRDPRLSLAEPFHLMGPTISLGISHNSTPLTKLGYSNGTVLEVTSIERDYI